MLPSEAHPLCRSDTIFLIAFAVDGGQTSSGPFVMICLHYAQSLFWLERCRLHTQYRQDRVNGRSWPYEVGVWPGLIIKQTRKQGQHMRTADSIVSFLRKLPQLLLLLLAHYVLHRAKHISAWIPTPTKRTITCCKCCNLTQYTQRSLKAWEGITLCTGSNGLNDCRLYSDLL